MDDEKYTEVSAKVRLLGASEGGIKAPVSAGYRPQMHFPLGYYTAALRWVESETLRPGEESNVRMVLLHPLSDLPGLVAGAVFDVTEGPRKIGEAEIHEVHERTWDSTDGGKAG